MRMNLERSHGKDLDMVDPEGLGRSKEEDWGSNKPFDKEEAIRLVEGMKALIDSLPPESDPEIEQTINAAKEQQENEEKARQAVLNSYGDDSQSSYNESERESETITKMDAVGSFGKSAREKELQNGLEEAQAENDEDAIEGYQAALQMVNGQNQEQSIDNSLENPTTHQPEVEQEETEAGPNTLILTAGEKSALKKIIHPDGKESTRLESEYFDISNSFNKNNNVWEKNPDLQIAMANISTDLALVDATNGENIENYDEKKKTEYLEDYSKLQSMLEDPKVSSEEKQLINDYFDAMDGTALKIMSQEYEKIQQKEQDEKNEIKNKAESIIIDVEDNLEASKWLLNEYSGEYDKSLAKVHELLNEKSIDANSVDDLQDAFNKLKALHDEMFQWIAIYEADNKEYIEVLYTNKDTLSEDEYNKKMGSTYDNERELSAAKRKVVNVDEEIPKIKAHISRMEDILDQINRF